MIVVAEAGDGCEAVRLAKELQPDVIVMDLMMPNTNGIEATRLVTATCPGTKVVALSMYSDSNFVSEMLRAGAMGFLLKDCAFTDLVEAVRAAVRHEVYLGPNLAKVVADMYVHSLIGDRKSTEPADPELTPRETEILQLLVKGNTNREVASALHLSIKTVANHRQNIMRKFHLKNAVELTKYAIRKGLVPAESSSAPK